MSNTKKDEAAEKPKSPAELLAEQQTLVNHDAEARAIGIQNAHAALSQTMTTAANPGPPAAGGEAAKPETLYALSKFDHRGVSYQRGVEFKEDSPAVREGLKRQGLIGAEKPDDKPKQSSPATAGETGSLDLAKAASGSGKKK